MSMSMRSADIPEWVSDFFSGNNGKGLASSFDREIVTHLIERSEEMKTVWEEIERKVPPHNTVGRGNILWTIIDAAVLWNESAAREERKNPKRLKTLQDEIITTSEKLIELLNRFSDIKENGRATSNAYFNLLYLIERATGETIQPSEVNLTDLTTKEICYYLNKTRQSVFSANYDILEKADFQQLLTVLSDEMSANPPLPHSVEDEVVLSFQKSSPMDFIRYLLTKLESCKERCRSLPQDFALTNKAVITITECALNLDRSLSEDYVTKAKKSLAENKGPEDLN